MTVSAGPPVLKLRSRAMRTARAGLLIALCAWVYAYADDGRETPLPQAADAEGEAIGRPAPWLDEVRAQRQASEARREATRKAMDTHRRWIDPWGAAQREAREREIGQRRQATRERIEQEREQLRARRPPIAPFPEIPPPPVPPWGEPQEPFGTEPPGWDNRWYYQGY